MIFQTIKMAWSAVCANKMRTFLTMLGVIIGVAALVILVSITNGATSSVTDSISSLGSNYLMVSITDDKENPIRWSEFLDLLEDDALEAAAPITMSSANGKSGYTEETVTLYGTSGAYFDIMDMEVTYGRNLKLTDMDNSSYVAVISADTAVQFFGRADVAGESFALDGYTFLVVGVLAEDDTEEDTSVTSSDSDDEEESTTTVTSYEAYIPYTTLSRIADNVLDITQFYVSSADEDSMDEAEEALEAILLARFEEDEDAYSITNMSEVMEALSSVTNTLSLLLGGIAAISLLVGGIGIMNIMLVSVTERTREIGIRKAIGASQGSILLQFLLEAIIVSLAGCVVGIGVSWIGLQIASRFMSMTFTMNRSVCIVAAGFSAAIGIIFGLYPARKAAKKKPIDALRYS